MKNQKTILAILATTLLLSACLNDPLAELGLNDHKNDDTSVVGADDPTHLNGGSDSTGTTTDTNTDTLTPVVTETAPTTPVVDPIERALVTGDARPLNATHGSTILQRATALTAKLRDAQLATLTTIYADDITNLALNHTTNSSSITATKSTIAQPLILSDNGTGMAAIATVGTGRGLAYGADVLAWMAGTTKEQQHAPLFKRAMTWLVTGNAAGTIPSTLNIGVAGYSGANASTYLKKIGAATVNVSTCNIQDTTNTCAEQLDLLVFGSGTTTATTALVRRYLNAGKPVVYMHPSWVDSAGGRQVLSAMGMSLGGYPGNYYAPATGVSVSATRTRADVLNKTSQFSSLLATLQALPKTDLTVDFATDTSLTAPIDAVHNTLATFQTSGINVFNDPDSELYKLLVLWADIQRANVRYGSPLSYKGDSDDFLRTYASDSWLVFNRTATIIPPAGAGDYMPVAANALVGSTEWETIPVTIAQASGITLIGRGAVPGRALEIEVVTNTAGATSLGIQTSYLRVWGKPLSDTTYARPRRPNSFNIPLKDHLDFVTPFGGPLMLSYSGATAGSTVTLRIKGAVKYAHFDFTQNPTEQELTDALDSLRRKDFGWQTSKLVGGEIQQTINYAVSAIGNLTPKAYVVDRLKGILFDSNHFANGYNNMPMSSMATSLCADFGWDCVSNTYHRAPNVQHFVGWIATCGFLCSGNPSDGSAGINIGWGWSHELGHNTVQRVMHIAPGGKGCVVECDNNILASATMLREYAILGIDTGHNLDHPGLYAMILANRATNLTGEALRQDMQTRLWGGSSQDPMRAVHFQMAFQYTKFRHGLSQPTMDTTLEFFQLLTKGDRLVARAWDATKKDRYGMGTFANNTIANEDLFYVLSSKIIGQDMRQHFYMYGIPLTQTALDSVAALNLPTASATYYALPAQKFNQLSTGQWVSLEGSSPAYPY
ncbi:MAG: ImpA family metalloprotease [Aquabacterium sp.]|uniref:ImpA family metalloprotease n=1 Tax=Aquabacterium sp. TaxID=1872578 RepID=UPI003BEAA4FA